MNTPGIILSAFLIILFFARFWVAKVIDRTRLKNMAASQALNRVHGLPVDTLPAFQKIGRILRPEISAALGTQLAIYSEHNEGTFYYYIENDLVLQISCLWDYKTHSDALDVEIAFLGNYLLTNSARYSKPTTRS